MKTYTTKGYINAVFAAISYGTNPLFALPMFSQGIGVNSVLFYRYLFAVIVYGLWLNLYKHTSFKISLKELFILFVFGIIFSLSLIVALISRIIFKEHLPQIIWLALCFVILGITLLYGGNTSSLNIKGVILALLSALFYAIYMVGIKHTSTIRHIKPDKLTFYVMLFGLSVYIWNLKFCTELQQLNNWFSLVCAFGLAVFPTIISLETITFGIKLIGATKTAIIGALEPLTALFFGVLLFGETLTFKIFCGIGLILSGVIIVILHKNKN